MMATLGTWIVSDERSGKPETVRSYRSCGLYGRNEVIPAVRKYFPAAAGQQGQEGFPTMGNYLFVAASSVA